MPDLLLELFSEEIPARMQKRASDDLKKLVTGSLVDAGLTYEAARVFATPRRLTLSVTGLPVKSPDTLEERKGPRVGAPEQALAGFMKAAGLSSIDEAEVVEDGKKGSFYVARTKREGRAATDIIAEIVPDVIRKFPWPKSMRWGAGSLRWVRPLHSILCTFGPETEEPEIVAFDVDGIKSGDTTQGHRFMAPGEITVRRFEDYVEKLEAAKVVLDPERRADMIRADAKTLAFAQGLDLVEDEALANEVAGLVEWPVPLMGSFDARFLEVPDEAIRATIRANQKCFVLTDPKTGKLTNRFIAVANIEAKDGGTKITAGNERVIAARLSDAKFFWETDLATKLEEHAKKLDGIVYHGERTLAEYSASVVDLTDFFASSSDEAKKAEAAAKLAKADLVTEMVGEFPELQGLMGKYYALAQEVDPDIAAAIEEHYKPQGPSDAVPSNPVSIVVALADKLIQLAWFWQANEKPTGSKDPYALRRAALGIIRIVLGNELRIRLRDAIAKADSALAVGSKKGVSGADAEDYQADLLSFFADRLKVQLRDEGARHDLVDAVFALPDQDDLLMIARRVEALGAFLDTDDGANLLTAYKRAANILRIEEKKDGTEYPATPDPDAFAVQEERSLFDALENARGEVVMALEREDFADAMTALSKLRGPVDTFFDDVTVNADDAAVRANRLKLLASIRDTMDRVAVFEKIGG